MCACCTARDVKTVSRVNLCIVQLFKLTASIAKRHVLSMGRPDSLCAVLHHMLKHLSVSQRHVQVVASRQSPMLLVLKLFRGQGIPKKPKTTESFIQHFASNLPGREYFVAWPEIASCALSQLNVDFHQCKTQRREEKRRALYCYHKHMLTWKVSRFKVPHSTLQPMPGLEYPGGPSQASLTCGWCDQPADSYNLTLGAQDSNTTAAGAST